MNHPARPTQPEGRHAFRVRLDAWNDSLTLRFGLSFAPGQRKPLRYGRSAADVACNVARVGARRVRWELDADRTHLVTHTARGGAVVKHLRAVAAAHAVTLTETDDVRCRKCLRWTDAECSVCNHCGGLA